MRINVSTDLLATLIGNANTINKRGQNVLITAEGADDGSVGVITVTAFEGTTISAWRGQAEIIASGRIAVRGDVVEKFLKLSSKADKLVQLETLDVDNRSSLRIISSRAAHEFDGYPTDVFDSIDPGRANIPLADLSSLAEALKTAKSTSASETEVNGARIALSGVHIKPADKEYHIVGTNGQRLAWCSVHMPALDRSDLPQEGIIIPGKIVPIVSAMIGSEPAAIRLVENSLIVENAGGTMSFPILDVPYPDYKRLIQVRGDHNIQVGSSEILTALERSSAAIGNEDRYLSATLARDDAGIHLTSNTTQESSSETLSEARGEEAEISFNVTFLKRAIQNIDARNVNISFTNVLAPIVITSEERPDLLMLVMPCKPNASR